jgi:aminomethyltransferase
VNQIISKQNKTPLYDEHVRLGGKIVDFAGWQLPIQYGTGINVEHLAVRSKAGLFDVSHMGEIVVNGARAAEFLDYVTCNHVAPIAIGKAQYTAFINPAGGVIDDLIITRLAADRFLLGVNASNTKTDFDWLREHSGRFNVNVHDASLEYGLLAIQGPLAANILGGVFPEVSSLKAMTAVQTKFSGKDAVISRTGYTGEDGFEIFVNWPDTPKLWAMLLEKGGADILPCGLGARDTLRLEAAFPLHGHEIGPSISPIEGGVSWIVKLSKGDFIGRGVLEKHKAAPLRMLVGLKLGAGPIARAECAVMAGGSAAGVVTSGTKTATLPYPIAMALVRAGSMKVGDMVQVMIRDRAVDAEVIALPFYKRSV